MNSLPKLMMISFMTQCHFLCDANGNSSNVGPYGGEMNPEEKWINDGKSSEMMKNVLSGINGRYGDKNTLALLQWLMNVPVFANTINQLTRIEPSSRLELGNPRPYPNERLLFRLKKAMKKPLAMLIRIGRQAKESTSGKENVGFKAKLEDLIKEN